MITPVTRNPDTITVHVPLTFARRGGRKQIVLPDGTSSWAPPRARVDNTMVKVIARGFRWRKLLETGGHVTVEDIAVAEKINASYVGRVLRLTLLAPDIVEATLMAALCTVDFRRLGHIVTLKAPFTEGVLR